MTDTTRHVLTGLALLAAILAGGVALSYCRPPAPAEPSVPLPALNALEEIEVASTNARAAKAADEINTIVAESDADTRTRAIAELLHRRRGRP